MSFSAAVLTVSDGVAGGTRKDESGAALRQFLVERGFDVAADKVVADEVEDIDAALRQLVSTVRLVVTTGGTGFGPRDVTPEATGGVLEKDAPGLQVAMLVAAIASTPRGALTRGRVGSVGSCLVVNLPGSPKGAIENLSAIIDLVPHVLDLLAGDTEHGPIISPG